MHRSMGRPAGWATSALLVAGLLMAGCLSTGVQSPTARQGPRGSEVGVTWFWGLTSTVHYAQECHAGLAEVETHVPWYSYFVSPLTAGIVTPMMVRYTCARETRGSRDERDTW